MIKCDVCGKNITSKDDVNVLTLMGLVPRTFCNQCYAEKERGITRHLFYTPKHPINSKFYMIGLFIFTAIALILLIFLSLGIGETQGGIGISGRIFFASIILIVLIWQWALWLIAKSRVNSAVA